MAKVVDLELKKAFAELQATKVETKEKLTFADMQIDGLQRTVKHAMLTDKEISALDPSVRTYQSIGRMFILQDLPKIRENIHKKITKCDEKIKTLEGNKTYLERTLKESENNIREMVQQRKDNAQE